MGAPWSLLDFFCAMSGLLRDRVGIAEDEGDWGLRKWAVSVVCSACGAMRRGQFAPRYEVQRLFPLSDCL